MIHTLDYAKFTSIPERLVLDRNRGKWERTEDTLFLHKVRNITVILYIY